MTAQTPCTILWVLGLSAGEQRLVQETAGGGYFCRSLDGLHARELAAILERGEADDPLLLWLGSRAWLELRREQPEIMQSMELVPSVLVLECGSEREVLEQALDAHFQQVLRAPLDRPQVFDALSRAREARNMYLDMTRMAREIMMNRELLERKSDVCSFLFRSFAGIGGAGDARALLAECGRAMGEVFAVHGLHAVWWGSGPAPVYIVGAEPNAPAAETWVRFLRDRTSDAVAGNSAPDGGGAVLYAGGGGEGPETGQVIMLTLDIHGVRHGVLALHVREPLLPGRDMAQALDAVRHYVALTLWERGTDRKFFAGSEAWPKAGGQAGKPQSAVR